MYIASTKDTYMHPSDDVWGCLKTSSHGITYYTQGRLKDTIRSEKQLNICDMTVAFYDGFIIAVLQTFKFYHPEAISRPNRSHKGLDRLIWHIQNLTKP